MRTRRWPHLPLALAILAGAMLACAGGEEAPSGEDGPTAAPEPAPAPAAAAAADPGFYSDRALTSADLAPRNLRELSLMRNTIFARTGHVFVKPWLDTYFRAQPWYTPKPQGADFSTLSDIDRANVKAIADAEQRYGKARLKKEKAELLAKRSQVGLSDAETVELALVGAALGEYLGSDKVPVEQRNPLEDVTALDRQLTRAQLEPLSRRDLRLLRNTVFARHGRQFKSEVLTWYFEDKAWYSASADYSDAALNDVDKRNIALIQSMEERLGGPLSEWEHMEEEGWFAGA